MLGPAGHPRRGLDTGYGEDLREHYRDLAPADGQRVTRKGQKGASRLLGDTCEASRRVAPLLHRENEPHTGRREAGDEPP